MQNYKDILKYNILRTNLDGKLETYNIFDNTKTYMRACKTHRRVFKDKRQGQVKNRY